MVRFALVLALSLPLAAGASSRGDVVRQVMPASVRVQLLSKGQVKRTATGVVVATEPSLDGRPARSAILTNAHVAAPDGLPDVTWQVLLERRGRVVRTLPARLSALGQVPEMDLAVLEVDETLAAVTLGDEELVDLGDELVVVGAPYGKSLSVSGGMVSQLEAEEGEVALPLRYSAMKTDAAIGYGSSGGGVFHVPSGRLVGIVEGYRTARVAIGEKLAFDVPMPGETFIAPITKVKRFLATHLAAGWGAFKTATAVLQPPPSTPPRPAAHASQ